MPIRPENRSRYPVDWPQISARVRARAGQCCELCGVKNHALGGRLRDGTWCSASPRGEERLGLVWPKPGEFWWCSDADGHMYELRIVRIVLTVAHLDHQPENCAEQNLKAMCQRCHLRYDQAHHAQTAARTRREGKARADLFMDDIPGHVLASAGF